MIIDFDLKQRIVQRIIDDGHGDSVARLFIGSLRDVPDDRFSLDLVGDLLQLAVDRYQTRLQ